MPPEKWYLNLRPDAENKNRGLQMDLVAKRKTFHSPGAVRRSVDWTLVRDLRGFEEGRIDPKQGKLTQANPTAEGDDHTFRNGIALPPVTNVLYTVTARKAAAQGGNNVAFNKSYETWRLVHYDVVYMDAACKAAYDAVKARFVAAFAEAGFEMKEGTLSQVAANKVEAVTDRGAAGGVYMTHLYDKDRALPHAPHHLRLVIVKDIVEVKDTEVSWKMDRNTAKGTGLTRVWSTGDVVHYESPIQVMTANPASGTISGVLAPAIPDQAIARVDDHTLEVDLNDPALAGVEACLTAGRAVALKGKLAGAKCDTVAIKLRIDHGAKTATPAVVGSTQVWAELALGQWVLHIKDDDRTWAAAPAKAVVVTRVRHEKNGPGHWATDDVVGETVTLDGAATLVRVNDHELTLDITTITDAPDILAAAAPRSVKRRVGVGEGIRKEVTFKQALSLSLELLAAAGDVVNEVEATVDEPGGSVSYVAARHVLQVKDAAMTWKALADHPLSDASLRASLAPVDIPAAQATAAADGSQVDIDLNHVDLDVVRQAFAAGSTIELNVTFRVRESIGGYSPEKGRDFVALTTKRMKPDEADDRTQARLLACLLHEIGHGHGLVGSLDTYYTGGHAGTRGNPKFYKDEYGGVGPHCSHNAALVPSGASYGRLPTTSGQIYYHRDNAGKLCVMYHMLDLDNGAPRYCESCLKQLRLAATLELSHDPLM